MDNVKDFNQLHLTVMYIKIKWFMLAYVFIYFLKHTVVTVDLMIYCHICTQNTGLNCEEPPASFTFILTVDVRVIILKW